MAIVVVPAVLLFRMAMVPSPSLSPSPSAEDVSIGEYFESMPSEWIIIIAAVSLLAAIVLLVHIKTQRDNINEFNDDEQWHIGDDDEEELGLDDAARDRQL